MFTLKVPGILTQQKEFTGSEKKKKKKKKDPNPYLLNSKA